MFRSLHSCMFRKDKSPGTNRGGAATPRRGTVVLLAALALLAFAPPPALRAQPCGTPGRDGSPTLSGIVNTYYPGTATAAAGATSISVGTPSGAAAAIAAGDLLLVVQMQDAAIDSDNSANYGAGTGTGTGSNNLHDSGVMEYVVATGAVTAGSVAILGGGNGGVLVNTYTAAAATGTAGQRTFQVIRVPQYASPTLSASTALTALSWTGAVGGVLVIDVDGTLTLNGGTASVDSLGFRGGGGQTTGGSNGNAFADTDYRRVSTLLFDASKGEGIAGTPRFVYNGSTETDNGSGNEGYPNGSFARGAPGNAGGGGTDGDNDGSGNTTNQNNCGGGGGGNGGSGGLGGNCWSTDVVGGGVGGAAFTPSNNPAKAILGGGAGAGDSNNAGPGHGGPGGGMIVVRTNKLSGTGTFSADGAKPCTATATCTNVNGSGQTGSTQDAAGGGGAAGSVLVDVNTTNPPGGDSTSGLTIDVQGGFGGDVNWPDDDPHGPGGGGAGGVAYISAAGATVSVTHGGHGAAGNPTSDDVAFGSADGTDGVTSTGPITFTGGRPGYHCITSQALVTAIRALPLADGGLVIEWQTSSQAGTTGFEVLRYEPATRTWTQLNHRLLPAAIEAPQGAVYRFRDAAASPFEPHTYVLIETAASGRRQRYGPYTVAADFSQTPLPLIGDYARSPRPPAAAAGIGAAGEPAEPAEAIEAAGIGAGEPAAAAAATRVEVGTVAAGAAATTAAAAAAPTSHEPGTPQPGIQLHAPVAEAPSPQAMAAQAPLQALAAKAPPAPAAAVATSLEIFVAQQGLYTLSAATIAASLGVAPSTVTEAITAHQLALASQGAPVAWQPAAGNAAILFWGQAPTGIYSPQNVYWLNLGQTGPTMQTVGAGGGGGSPAPTNTPLSFPSTVHFEQDLFAGVAIPIDPASNYWFWAATISGDPTYGSATFPLDVHAVAASGSATLTAHLQGASATGVPGEHHLQVLLNGTPIGSTTWQGFTRQDAAFTFSSSLLLEGANQVEIVGLLDPGVTESITYTQSFDLSYRRLPLTDGSPLLVTPDTPGTVTVSGFATANLAVYDLTAPALPVALAGTTVDSAGGAYRVSFVPPASGHTYLAADTSTAGAPPVTAWQTPAQPLRSAANQAYYVVIAPAALAGPASTLVAHRQAQGLDSMLVTLEQIYFEFNDGMASPLAVQSFLSYAAGSWKKKPMAVVLAGDGTYDYKNYLGLGGNLVPPLMLGDADGLFASDSLFLASPGAAGMVIGRLPATSASQLAGIVAKIIAYESTAAAPWQQQVLLAADVPDNGGDFEVDSNMAAAAIAPPFAATKLYIAELTPAVAHQELLADLASGAYVLNFIGHGGLDRLSAESLLTSQDAAALANGARLPVVATATCIIGRFEIPGFESLAVTLLNNPSGGAAAVWAPSGLTFNAQTATLDRAFLPYLLAGQSYRLRDAVVGAVQAFTAAGGAASTLALYNLFGDPEMLLRKP
jgi:hypothetical protein